MSAPDLLVAVAGARTPCCDRVPAPASSSRWLCRGCGTIYAPARELVEAVFGSCADVTPMTPRRLLRSSSEASWTDGEL